VSAINRKRRGSESILYKIIKNHIPILINRDESDTLLSTLASEKKGRQVDKKISSLHLRIFARDGGCGDTLSWTRKYLEVPVPVSSSDEITLSCTRTYRYLKVPVRYRLA